VRANATFTAPKLEKSGSVDVRANATFTAPKLEKSGSIYVSENAIFTAPKLEKSGSVDVSENAAFTAPKLTEVSGYVYVSENATFTAPKLEKSGYVYVSENATFTAPSIKVSKNQAKFNNKTFDVVQNDGILFYVESEKNSKGIRIKSGFLKIKIENNLVVGEKGFLVEKECFSAHGEDLKSAISDLQFKIVAERLKSEPIYEDTELTVMHYRTITGACDIGCRDFMEKNGISFKIENGRTVEEKTIKAKDLIPMLEKHNAYGLEKFKSLLSFKN
jgi:hypothetical protein